MWARKRVANERTSFNFIKIESVEKIGLGNSKKFFSAHTFLAYGFLTAQKKYQRLKDLGTRNLLKTQKTPLFFHLTWIDYEFLKC